MKVISYNLNKHKAIGELDDLVEATGADILCLQEAVSGELAPEIAGLKLVEATARNRLGLAVYLRRNSFDALEVRSLALKKSLHDRVLKPAEERMLAVRLRDIDHGREFIVASFHAAPLTALNSLRRKQISAALGELASLGDNLPILMVGDYNYPVFKENLGQKVRDAGYELSLSDARTYTRYKFFRGHYDFATSVGFDIDTITTLPQGRSDHLPILVTATPKTASIV
ncbi:endonuclease/exonuclease/phosphatase family protein [Microbacterium lacticum]|uniref:endonuclease/exonuclease/phosphatase family protein n=1 Tax=Microbacterium lacticum TaxID=33885 RepID=UPI0018B0DB5D|nr:endonuclease/exonuclease/phosphatase family protein [Microbacterium lacticum]MBF9337539.1 endonuclease/exonuclease/phosphatase family protein [Microbacterium lacticum]